MSLHFVIFQGVFNLVPLADCFLVIAAYKQDCSLVDFLRIGMLCLFSFLLDFSIRLYACLLLQSSFSFSMVVDIYLDINVVCL